MTREDPLILPVCQRCGEYKGVGKCKNPKCVEFENQNEEFQANIVEHPCCKCGRELVVVCNQCGKGYCKIHSRGVRENRLASFHQCVGTCIECKQIVCEDCWILNPNGDIVCLTHLEKERKTGHFR